MTPPSFVRVSSNFTDASGTSLASGAAVATVGDLLVVNLFYTNPGSAVAVSSPITDSAGNSFTRVASSAVVNGNDQAEVWWAPVTTGSASNVVTANWPSNVSFRRIIVGEYSGQGATPVDAGFSGTTAAGTSVTGTLTTVEADELLIAYSTSSNSETWAVTGGNTRIAVGVGTDTGGGDKAAATPGSNSIVLTCGVSGRLTLTGVAIRSPQAAAAVPFVPHRMPLGV